MASSPILVAENVKMYFSLAQRRVLKAVDDVSFTLDAGETLGLVGESGCGKTTLARALLRLYEPTAGRALVDGVDWFAMRDQKQMRATRRKMQMVFQDPFASLDPRQTVGNAVAEPMRVAGLHKSRRETERAVEELFEKVGLSTMHIRKFPHEFSGGQLQRVGIARALALQPRVIFADEPVSALDVSIRAQVLNLFSQLQRELNLALVFISHDLSLVRYMAHRVAVMYLGRLVELGPTEEICMRPAHPYTRMLIESIPHPDPSQRLFLGRKIQTELPSPLNVPAGCPFHPRCPHAQDICAREVPAVRRTSAGTDVRCHFPLV